MLWKVEKSLAMVFCEPMIRRDSSSGNSADTTNSVAVHSAAGFLQKTFLSMFGCSKKARAASRTRSGSAMACAKKRGKFGSSFFDVVIAF